MITTILFIGFVLVSFFVPSRIESLPLEHQNVFLNGNKINAEFKI